jgi:nicotinamide-nucleotide amidase
MKAAVLAVGSELLGEDRAETNSLAVAALLRRHGVALVRKAVVGDDEDAIAGELARMAAECELVVVSGGLGPTSDDVTREAAARAFGGELREDPAIAEEIRRRFAAMGRSMPEVNRRQALVPAGATVIANPRGTAPGLRLESGAATVFLLPGVPAELQGLLDDAVAPWLAARCGEVALESLTLRVAGLPESEVEELIAAVYDEFGRADITLLAGGGDVRLRLTAGGEAAPRQARLAGMAQRLRGLLGVAVYGEGDEELEAAVGRLLLAAGQTLASAESCTGGLVGERVTRVPGSSAWYVGSVVAYDDRLKRELLGVPPDLLREHGAVSEAVARAMAAAARQRLGSDWAIGITGVAGPGGGSAEKPVGTVHVAVAGPAAVAHRLLRLPGERARVRWLASHAALEMLRRRLLAAPPAG